MTTYRNLSIFGPLMAILMLLGLPASVLAGDLDSPSAPCATSSYTLEDVYNRLDAGTVGSQSTFTEPVAGPTAGTMHTINEIMGKAPAKDDANGAAAGNVMSGKTFWGLLSVGGWGPQTGSLVTQTPDNATVSQPAGYYDAFDLSTVDTDLATGKSSSYKATATKIEMFNGTGWVTLFSGPAQLDLVTGGTFPGISDLNLPPGPYSKIRVTFKNTFPTSGSLVYNGTTYYTTAATFGGQTNPASVPTTDSGSMAVHTFRIAVWGARCRGCSGIQYYAHNRYGGDLLPAHPEIYPQQPASAHGGLGESRLLLF